jgi:Arc/MetJ-type ribon-helix-helix transcriptional regulator
MLGGLDAAHREDTRAPVLVSAHLDPELAADLRALAQARGGASLASLVRVALRRLVDAYQREEARVTAP